MKKIYPYLLLHGIIFLNSIGGICSKTAAAEPFLSFKWILFYGLLILILGIYAILWQQALKRIPLNVAYPNKAVNIIWSMLWGVLLFNERISALSLLGAAIVLFGVVLMVTGEEKKNEQ